MVCRGTDPELQYSYGEKNSLTTSRTNKDLDPVPRHNRKWGVTSFLAYWISDAFKYDLEFR